MCRLPSYNDWQLRSDGRLVIKGLLVPAQPLQPGNSTSSSSGGLSSGMCNAVLTARLQLPGDGEILTDAQTEGEVQLRLVSQLLEDCKVIASLQCQPDCCYYLH